MSSHCLPIVTVAMVTFNSERYVSEAIESILCQTYENLELLICDDCSSDSTWEIICSYQDNRIRAIRNERNLGEYANRNLALSLAKGKYITFIDGDDILYPHGLDIMVKCLLAHPTAAMAMARPWNEKYIYPALVDSQHVYRAHFLGHSVLALNFTQLLLVTDVARAVGGFNTNYKMGDTYIQLRIAMLYPSLLITNGLAWWRRTPGQASERLFNERYNWLEQLLYIPEFLEHPKCPLSPPEVAVACTNLIGGFLRMCWYLLLSGRVKQGLRLIRLARLPLYSWKYFFTPAKRIFDAERTAENPFGDWRVNGYLKQ